jgi:ABC-type transporter Mla maintaining outer membrane lipid asymmetry permease subunit MlaE
MGALVLRDVVTGLIKSVMFGLVITTVGCRKACARLGAKKSAALLLLPS